MILTNRIMDLVAKRLNQYRLVVVDQLSLLSIIFMIVFMQYAYSKCCTNDCFLMIRQVHLKATIFKCASLEWVYYLSTKPRMHSLNEGGSM